MEKIILITLLRLGINIYSQNLTINKIEKWDQNLEVVTELFDNLEFTINEISFKTKDSGLRYIIYKDKELTDMVTNTNYGIQYSYNNSVYLVNRSTSISFIKKNNGWLIQTNAFYYKNGSKPTRSINTSFVLFKNGKMKNISKDEYNKI